MRSFAKIEMGLQRKFKEKTKRKKRQERYTKNMEKG